LFLIDRPDRCSVRFALEGMRFFAGESCGKCFPCRIGTTRLRERLEALAKAGSSQMPPASTPVRLKPDPREAGIAEMRDIIDVLHIGSACGLGPAAGILAKHLLEHFPDEVEAHRQGHCPDGECDNV
jgi:NADH-quinone oxidoreductase subunit F